MKAYGMNAMMAKGHKCAADDVSTKGWFHGTKKHQSRRRKLHQRIYKKKQRAFDRAQLQRAEFEA